MADKTKALQLFVEFYRVVDSIYGVYLDSVRGFHLVQREHIKEQQWTIKMLGKTDPKLAKVEYLDRLAMIYGKGDPNKPGWVELHRCSQAELKARNEEGGANQKFVANMCLVSIYQYWEDHYRKEIAGVLGKKSDIQSDIMGDIRLLRDSIVHHEAVGKKKVEKCKVLTWFKKGDEIFIDRKKFEEVIFHIYNYIEKTMSVIQSGITKGQHKRFGL